MDDNPPTIRLKFQPNGLGHAGDSYYLTEKKNECVVCGIAEKLARHWVVPHGFVFLVFGSSNISKDIDNIFQSE